ncbi:MAG TPA: hypothetical protein VM899_04540 [Rubellimicrobium sp.]|jgi:hypothetical protein|nr:hypothetical protein [Rubellimicrobium sp.]
MARLILFLMLFAALAFAFAAAVTAWRAMTVPTPAPLPALREEDKMPPAIRNTAYVLLFLLLAGLTSGWLGPA